jgi:hypothetical protein
MNYSDKLSEWFEAEKAAGRVVDLKFFPGVDAEGSINTLSRAVFETVTGERKTEPLDTTKL